MDKDDCDDPDDDDHNDHFCLTAIIRTHIPDYSYSEGNNLEMDNKNARNSLTQKTSGMFIPCLNHELLGYCVLWNAFVFARYFKDVAL